MNFSRRHAMAPSPPSPAFTLMRTSSTNFTATSPATLRTRNAACQLGPRRLEVAFVTPTRGPEPLGGYARASALRNDGDDAAITALDGVLHGPVDLREERVVAAHPDVLAGVELGAELAHEDVPRHHRLGAVDLHPAMLAGRVAPVARGA